MEKGQLSVEFIVIMGIVLFVLIAVIISVKSRTDEARHLENEFAARQVADEISSAIAQVVLLGEGSSRRIYIPENLRGVQNYTISLSNRSRLVTLNWNDQVYSAALLHNDLNVTSISRGGYAVFTYQNGVIFVD